MTAVLAPSYDDLKKAAQKDLKSEAVSTALSSLVGDGLDYLEKKCVRVKLASKIPGKSYFSFRTKGGSKTSRPVNSGLFDIPLTRKHLESAMGAAFSHMKQDAISRILYTAAMAYCCTTDLTKESDRKTPGTFFEVLVGHLVAVKFGVNPARSIQVLNLDLERDLPTDYVFDLGEGKNRIHLPVKISTRERVVQVWAHQRVLDGVYGVSRFRGVLVCLNETNKQSRTNSVIEVCLPG